MENSESAKKNGEKNQKMTLQGYYNGLPKRVAPKTEFINAVMYRTGKGYMTVFNWINGKCKPDNENDVKVLSELTGIEEKDLW